MNFWNFALCHPKAAVMLGLCVCASVTGIGIAFAKNKTSLIGTLSPTMNLNVGNEANVPETNQPVITAEQSEMNS